MLLLDVNVVLAAHRDDHPHHAAVRPWFDEVLAGEDPFAVPVVVWASFLRLATNRRIFEVPTPLADAFNFVEATCRQPHHLVIGPGARHLPVLRRLCEEADALGDLVPDAVIAAVALEHGCQVATLDRDFARFSSIRHLRPGYASPPAAGETPS
ncbi:MAG: type II toxin-antitoxin system VapC family toxin [Actinomycetota bacterium]|jgi:toxin-antitoxin system PIN domain toxin|nr:type II toxin-antitoxin system VapC family toxin [Actinomycetota bacterium]